MSHQRSTSANDSLDCVDHAKHCTKTLPCGHSCNGIQEEKCLPCLHGCKIPAKDGAEVKSKLTQKANDNCIICHEKLSSAPCIQLDCGHVLHYHCCNLLLQKRWSGPKISFHFMLCPLCKSVPITHSKLKNVLDPINKLCEDVKRKCSLRLKYKNKDNCEALTTSTSEYYQKPFEYAMSIYSYYVCFKCKKPYYYEDDVSCGAQAAQDDNIDPRELVCDECLSVAHDRAQVCAKHGEEFLEYKCRYCCSVAIFFCFGTTHFCNSCHNDHSRLTKMKEFPQCPVAPCAKPMEGKECPLHVQHPPTGEEFILGCGVCRNAQTF